MRTILLTAIYVTMVAIMIAVILIMKSIDTIAADVAAFHDQPVEVFVHYPEEE